MQASVRTNDLLNAVHYVATTSLGNLGDERSPGPPAHQEFTALVGEPYYALKQTLIMDEQYLLRSINFNIVVVHPHKFLLNYAKSIGAQHSLVQLAVSLLNDSIHHSALSVSHAPADVAAACLYTAGHILGAKADMQCVGNVSGWSAFGVSVQNLTAIAAVLLDLIQL